MKVIFVNWTRPFFNRKNFDGYKKRTTVDYEGDDYFLAPYEIVMQRAAITSAKKYTKLPLKLITDDAGYEYYKKIDLLRYFDEVDVSLLNELDKTEEINSAQFWTSGKIISICKETPPFIFMDLDLIIKNHLPDWIYDYDTVHTHWEISRSTLFIEHNMLTDYGLNIPEFDNRMLIPNTSLLFMNNQQVLDRYLELHMEIVTKKYDYVPDWLWLMSDQNILGYTLRSLNSKVSQFEDKTFVQFPDISQNKDKPGYFPDWLDIHERDKTRPDFRFEHVWLNKASIGTIPDYQKHKLKEWNKIIDDNGFDKKSLI